ncbi:MAG: hypothetical protein ACP5TW_06430 [Thermoplasmata archaeon]
MERRTIYVSFIAFNCVMKEGITIYISLTEKGKLAVGKIKKFDNLMQNLARQNDNWANYKRDESHWCSPDKAKWGINGRRSS